MKKTASLVCVIILLVCGLNYANKLLMNKKSYEKHAPFFSSELEYDVLFFGSSHVHNGISPLYLWKNYGITSYNMAMAGNYIQSNSYRLKEVLEFIKRKGKKLPEMIVVDIYTDQETTGWLHSGWDALPLSSNKVEMVKKLVPEQERIGMLVPFYLYHNRWNELKKDDFQVNTNQYCGSMEKYGISYPANEIISVSTDIIEVDEEITNYLDEIRAECESKGIQLIFIHLPYSYRPDLQRLANGICQYEETQGITCVNYMNEATAIDYDIDFYDDGHLNIVGMRIMTDEIGQLLSKFSIEDHRGDLQSEQWERAYDNYIQYRVECVKRIGNVKIFLMAINDPDLLSSVQIYEGALGDIQISKLIERLKAEGHQIVITEERPEIVSEDGQVKHYDVYCEVYRRDDSDKLIHSAGFTM